MVFEFQAGCRAAERSADHWPVSFVRKTPAGDAVDAVALRSQGSNGGFHIQQHQVDARACSVSIASHRRCLVRHNLTPVGVRTPGIVGRPLATPPAAPGSDEPLSQGCLGIAVRGASWNSSRPRAAAIAATTPSPCDRAAAGRVTVVRCPIASAKSWSAGLALLAAPPAAAGPKLKTRTRPFPVKHRLTISFPQRAVHQPITYRLAVDYDTPPRSWRGPDRTQPERPMLLKLSGGHRRAGRRPESCSRGLGLQLGQGPGENSGIDRQRCVDCGICTSVLPQRRLEQRPFPPGSSLRCPSAVFGREQCIPQLPLDAIALVLESR